jgi:hypothetical protein
METPSLEELLRKLLGMRKLTSRAGRKGFVVGLGGESREFGERILCSRLHGASPRICGRNWVGGSDREDHPEEVTVGKPSPVKREHN